MLEQRLNDETRRGGAGRGVPAASSYRHRRNMGRATGFKAERRRDHRFIEAIMYGHDGRRFNADPAGIGSLARCPGSTAPRQRDTPGPA